MKSSRRIFHYLYFPKNVRAYLSISGSSRTLFGRLTLMVLASSACTETGGEDTLVPLPNVQSKILSKVIEYCKFHVEASKKNNDDKPAKTEEEVKTFDTDFVKVDQATLFELILVRLCSLSASYSIMCNNRHWHVEGQCKIWNIIVKASAGQCMETSIASFHPLFVLWTGCQLPEYQVTAGPWMPYSCQHD